MDKNYEVLCVSQVSCLIVGVVCPFNFIEDADWKLTVATYLNYVFSHCTLH